MVNQFGPEDSLSEMGIIIVGFTSGTIPAIPVNRLLLKNARAEGLYWGELLTENLKKLEMTSQYWNNYITIKSWILL